MTVKCVSIGGCEIHVVNCLIYLSRLIYVCHLSLWDFYSKHAGFEACLSAFSDLVSFMI